MTPESLERREALDEQVGIKLPSDLKAKVWQMAARQRIPASHLMREAIRNYTTLNAA